MDSVGGRPKYLQIAPENPTPKSVDNIEKEESPLQKKSLPPGGYFNPQAGTPISNSPLAKKSDSETNDKVTKLTRMVENTILPHAAITEKCLDALRKFQAKELLCDILTTGEQTLTSLVAAKLPTDNYVMLRNKFLDYFARILTRYLYTFNDMEQLNFFTFNAIDSEMLEYIFDRTGYKTSTLDKYFDTKQTFRQLIQDMANPKNHATILDKMTIAAKIVPYLKLLSIILMKSKLLNSGTRTKDNPGVLLKMKLLEKLLVRLAHNPYLLFADFEFTVSLIEQSDALISRAPQKCRNFQNRLTRLLGITPAQKNSEHFYMSYTLIEYISEPYWQYQQELLKVKLGLRQMNNITESQTVETQDVTSYQSFIGHIPVVAAGLAPTPKEQLAAYLAFGSGNDYSHFLYLLMPYAGVTQASPHLINSEMINSEIEQKNMQLFLESEDFNQLAISENPDYPIKALLFLGHINPAHKLAYQVYARFNQLIRSSPDKAPSALIDEIYSNLGQSQDLAVLTIAAEMLTEDQLDSQYLVITKKISEITRLPLTLELKEFMASVANTNFNSKKSQAAIGKLWSAQKLFQVLTYNQVDLNFIPNLLYITHTRLDNNSYEYRVLVKPNIMLFLKEHVEDYIRLHLNPVRGKLLFEKLLILALNSNNYNPHDTIYDFMNILIKKTPGINTDFDKIITGTLLAAKTGFLTVKPKQLEANLSNLLLNLNLDKPHKDLVKQLVKRLIESNTPSPELTIS